MTKHFTDLVARRVTRNRRAQRLFCEFHGGLRAGLLMGDIRAARRGRSGRLSVYAYKTPELKPAVR